MKEDWKMLGCKGILRNRSLRVKRLFFFVLIVCVPLSAVAFETSYSPVSYSTEYTSWGTMTMVQSFSVGYQSLFGVHFYHLHMWDEKEYQLEDGGPVYTIPSGSWAGLFLTMQLDWHQWYLRSGPGFFHRSFPDDNGKQLNFLVKLGVRIYPWLSLSYSHISNAYRGVINPGVDHFSVNLHLPSMQKGESYF
jgi:hypothetical protein